MPYLKADTKPMECNVVPTPMWRTCNEGDPHNNCPARFQFYYKAVTSVSFTLPVSLKIGVFIVVYWVFREKII